MCRPLRSICLINGAKRCIPKTSDYEPNLIDYVRHAAITSTTENTCSDPHIFFVARGRKAVDGTGYRISAVRYRIQDLSVPRYAARWASHECQPGEPMPNKTMGAVNGEEWNDVAVDMPRATEDAGYSGLDQTRLAQFY